MIGLCLFSRDNVGYYVVTENGEIPIFDHEYPTIKECVVKYSELIVPDLFASDQELEILPCFNELSPLIIPVQCIIPKLQLNEGYNWTNVTSEFGELSERLIATCSRGY